MKSEMSLRYDLRRRRATALTAAVLGEMRRQGVDLHDDYRGIHDALMNVFTQEGVEVVTDYTRAEAGLPPRGPDGWTLEEMAALERARLEAITAPIRFTVPSTSSAPVPSPVSQS